MSTQVSDAGYGNNSYGKASLSYIALKDLLGDDQFKKSLHFYMNTWNGKHPIPWDFFNCINTSSGKNLNWFFNNWFFTNNYIDLAIDKAEKSKGTISIKNVGGFAIPFDIVIVYSDDSKEVLHQKPSVWEANQKSAVISLKSKKEIKSISLDNGIFMDATPSDNIWNSK